MILRLRWFITRHLLPYGILAAGKRASLVDDAVASQTLGAYTLWAKFAKWYVCRACGIDILAWRKLVVCRRFSCYREVKQSAKNSKPLSAMRKRAVKPEQQGREVVSKLRVRRLRKRPRRKGTHTR